MRMQKIQEARARAKELTRTLKGFIQQHPMAPSALRGTVSHIMTRGAATCGRWESLAVAARVLWEVDCGVVPIVDGEQVLVGVLTDRDLCMASYTQGRPLSEIPVEGVLSREPVTIQESDSLDRAVELMMGHSIRRLIVVDGEQHCVGVLSLADLVRYCTSESSSSAAREALIELLAQLSRPRAAPEAESAS